MLVDLGDEPVGHFLKAVLGSALGLRVATNRVGQAFILAVAGAVSGVLGVEAAFVLLRQVEPAAAPDPAR